MLDLHGYGPSILEGSRLTLGAALLSVVIAVLLGLLSALAKLSSLAPLRAIAVTYTTLIRGVPDLVLMLLLFYGGQTLVNQAGDLLGWDYVDINPFIAGVLTIGVIYGAYMSETFRGAIMAVPAGQLEAARAFGMRPLQVSRRILLPQMLRHALPGFGNNWLVLLKATALLSVIGLDDMVRKATLAGGATRQPFTFLIVVALVYLALTTVSVLALGWAERRANFAYLAAAEMDLSIIRDNLGLYLVGLRTTVLLTAGALILGLLLAVPLAILRTSSNRLVNWPVFAFTYFFRGTPLLVQLFLIYYGAGQFEPIRQGPLWPLLSQAWFCALLAFTLNTAAYTTEIIRGAITATPRGEVEAARACGMSRALMLRRIILPSAFRRALPAYGNEVIFMLHGSAVASVVTIVDLTGAARLVYARSYAPYEAFTAAAVFYLTLTFVTVWLFRQLEHRWFAHLRARPA